MDIILNDESDRTGAPQLIMRIKTDKSWKDMSDEELLLLYDEARSELKRQFPLTHS